jgi:hypothetical protein
MSDTYTFQVRINGKQNLTKEGGHLLEIISPNYGDSKHSSSTLVRLTTDELQDLSQVISRYLLDVDGGQHL